MLLSDLCITRPVLATVMSLLIVLAGIAAFLSIPVREYPDVDNPVVSITTVYVGASPATVESTITEPLEQSLNGVEGIRNITSISGFSRSSITVEFLAGRDIDLAVTDVSNALQRAFDDIPEEAERPVVAKSGANTFPIMWLGLQSETYSTEDLTDIVDRVVKPPLQILPGVAEVFLGGRKYAMRIWLDPARMALHGVDPADIHRTIIENNLQVPAGEVEGTTRKFTVLADAQIDDPSVYENLIIREEGETRVRLKDIAWAELGSENYNVLTRLNGRPTVGAGIVRQSRSNQLEVSDAVRRSLPAIRAALPDGVDLRVAVDSTIFVRASLAEVWFTLGVVFGLVVVVNLVFLRSAVTTLISSIAIPVSLIGTFAVMLILGFSVNVLTLLALVLAIGLLVDDSIVVMENVYRRQELGETRRVSVRRGAKEVGFPVIATTVALVAVLIPLSLLTGNLGRLFREFALTMAASVLISTFVALTLVPMLCSQFLTVRAVHGRFYYVLEPFFARLNRGYEIALRWALHHRPVMGLLLVATIGFGLLLLHALPSTLVPVEDRGRIITVIKAPQGSTLAYTAQTLERVEKRMQQIPEVEAFFEAIGLSIGGPPNTSDGIVFARLTDWEKRSVAQQAIVARLFPEFFALTGALVFPINPPSLNQRSINDLEFILKNAAATQEEFTQTVSTMLERVRQLPSLINVDSDLRLDNPQLDMIFDRDRAADLGVPVSSVAQSLQLLLSQAKIDEFIMRGKQYDVVTALASRYRSLPDQIGEIYVRSQTGTMVPLSGLVHAAPSIAPAQLNRYDLQRSATITGSLAPGATLGEMLTGVQRIAGEVLPAGFTTALGGSAREFVESSAEIYIVFLIALVFIYLVLSAQFENFFHALTILGSVPLALFGALFVLFMTGHTLNLYSQIGIILLIGLVTKNSILLVDSANQSRARGTELLAAVLAAGRSRLRPIVMTSATSIFGALPLALAVGAGAESRRPIGAAVVGGLAFSTAFTLLVIPVVYLFVTYVGERLGINMVPPRVKLIEDEQDQEAVAHPASKSATV